MKTDEAPSLLDKLNGRDFFDLMQQYRIAPIEEQHKVVDRFEAVKVFIYKEFVEADANRNAGYSVRTG